MSALSEWVTPQALAGLCLAGFPSTDRRVRTWAEKNLAKTRKKLSGKGIEIAITSLPIDVQRAILAKVAAEQVATFAPVASPSPQPSSAGGEGVKTCGLTPGSSGLIPPSPQPSSAGGEGVKTCGLTPGSSTLTPSPSSGGREAGSGEESTLIGALVGAPLANAADHARAAQAVKLMTALKPLLMLPERSRGRRAMAEAIGVALGVGFQQVYRLAATAAEGGVAALARLGARADRGVARCLVSRAFEVWAEGVVSPSPQSSPAGGKGAQSSTLGSGSSTLSPSSSTLSPSPSPAGRGGQNSQGRGGNTGLAVQGLEVRLRQAVRQAAVAGAPSARQAWLKATALLGRQLMDEGVAQSAVAALLQLECPRRWVEGEMQQFAVAGRSLRDAKGCYDHNITPVKRTAAGLLPGELVCGDVSPLDIPVLREDGGTAYARMIAWHDVATNWLWIDLFLVDKGEGVRREHVAASFARMCELAPFGAPIRLYLDNGSEYKWEEMLQAWGQLAVLTGQKTRVDMADLLPDAGRLVRSIPFHPRGKRIEGQFGHLERWLGWWFGHVGGNRMTKKSANLGRDPLSSDFLAVKDWLKRTLDDYQVTRQPGAEHMRAMSPQQRIEHFLSAGWMPYRIEREALLLAFAEHGSRRVTRGAINFKGRTWTADFLMGLEGAVEIAFPKVALLPDEEILYVFLRGKLLGAAYPERTFGILQGEGAKEAGRRRQAFKLVMADKIEQAGGAMDEAALAGFRASVLGLDATLNAAQAASTWVEGSEDLAAMVRARAAHVSERTQALLRRAEAAKDAESLSRLAFEDEETAAARALGF